MALAAAALLVSGGRGMAEMLLRLAGPGDRGCAESPASPAVFAARLRGAFEAPPSLLARRWRSSLVSPGGAAPLRLVILVSQSLRSAPTLNARAGFLVTGLTEAGPARAKGGGQTAFGPVPGCRRAGRAVRPPRL